MCQALTPPVLWSFIISEPYICSVCYEPSQPLYDTSLSDAIQSPSDANAIETSLSSLRSVRSRSGSAPISPGLATLRKPQPRIRSSVNHNTYKAVFGKRPRFSSPELPCAMWKATDPARFFCSRHNNAVAGTRDMLLEAVM